jgi:predicted aspartyl protease
VIQRALTANAEEVNAMNCPLFSSPLLVLLTLPSAGRTCSQTASAFADPTTQEQHPVANVPTKLPFHLSWGYLVIVEGSIGNFQKLNFLVDTGASPSIVDQKIARSLGLTGRPARVNLSNQTVQTRTVVLPSLAIGPIRVASFPVLAQDLSFFQKNLGYKVDAIVGLDVLRKSSFTINYKTKEITFGPIESLSFSAPFETDTPIVTIPVESQHWHLRIVIDTGGPDLMLFQSRLVEPTGFQPLGIETALDAGGKVLRRKVRIPEVYLGRENIGSLIAFVTDDRKDDGDNFDGVLGVRGAQFWKIAFDFEHRKFYWERTPTN